MNKLTIDFETYFDADITLKKLNYTEYVAKTHVMCCSISLDDNEPIYLINDSIESTLRSINWPNIELICHNALFDALILKHHYGIEAAQYSDTLAASRLLHHTWKHDLAGLATALGLDGESKQHTALTSVKGMTWDALTIPQQQTLVDYNLNDVRLTKAIYDILWPQVPQIERDIIDHTIKLFLRPALVLDSEMAQLALDEERLETERLINESGLDKTSIRSDTKFSAHLRSLGYETPVKWSVKKSCNIPAFAKNDPSDFYDGNPEIQPLLDLKRRINSNIKESRTERLLSSCAVHNGKIPVAYNYCGAFTARFSGSNRLNLQNLPRGSILRSCITTPPGQTLVVCDLSQVEARLTAWFCGEEKLLTSFREQRDIYCDVASEIFGKPVNKKDHPHERFCGKCLSADTKVLTDSGWKSIIKVTITDLLWDGVSWVSHKGLSLSGNLKTLTGYGVTATSQHLMLTLDGWHKWEDILTNPSLFQSALKSANLPSSIGYATSNPQADQADGILSLNALADGKGVLTELTSKWVAPLAATAAQKSQALQNAIGHIKTLCLMTNTALASLTASPHVSADAISLHANNMSHMEIGAYQFSQNGVSKNHHFSNMYKQSKAGIFQNFKWIASITRAITNLVTSVSLPAESTNSTKEKQTPYHKKSLPLPKRIPVYDLLSAGPNNRFTIWSNEGPIIAHNSAVLGLGYGMGAERFQAWCKQSGATLELDFCQDIVKKYREKFSEISSTWKALNLNIYKLKSAQKIHPISSNVAYTEPTWLGNKQLPIMMTPNKIHLPSGRVLNYGEVITGEQGGLRIENGRYIHGAMLLENIIQALSRDILVEQILIAEHLYPVVMHTHDEIVWSVPSDEAAMAKELLLLIMRKPPDWCADLPLDAEAGTGQRFSEAK